MLSWGSPGAPPWPQCGCRGSPWLLPSTAVPSLPMLSSQASALLLRRSSRSRGLSPLPPSCSTSCRCPAVALQRAAWAVAHVPTVPCPRHTSLLPGAITPRENRAGSGCPRWSLALRGARLLCATALCCGCVISSELCLGPVAPPILAGDCTLPHPIPLLCSTPAGPQGARMPSRLAQPLQRDRDKCHFSPVGKGLLLPFCFIPRSSGWEMWVPVWGRQQWLSRTPVVP